MELIYIALLNVEQLNDDLFINTVLCSKIKEKIAWMNEVKMSWYEWRRDERPSSRAVEVLVRGKLCWWGGRNFFVSNLRTLTRSTLFTHQTIYDLKMTEASELPDRMFCHTSRENSCNQMADQSFHGKVYVLRLEFNLYCFYGAWQQCSVMMNAFLKWCKQVKQRLTW